jgi:hypothetical protein
VSGGPRTRMVLTVANLDTGAVASASVGPGDVAPEPAPYGGWRVPLRPVLDELAAQVKVDASTLRDLRRPDRPSTPELPLPPTWRPDRPDAERVAGLVEAHTTNAACPAWTIHLGRTVAAPPVSVDDQLGRLCALADLLCLDLVVEARWQVFVAGLNWDIRFEVPGAAVPRDQRGYAESLPAALDRTAVLDAFGGLGERSLTAPAYFLRPQQRSALPPEEIDVDQLERRIVRDCGAGPSMFGDRPTAGGVAGGGPRGERTSEVSDGAQAIWRDGRWRHTSLWRIPGPRPAIPERAPVLRRAWQPPAPAWLGEPIPSVPCPDCHATGWRHPVLTCRRCGGHGRRYAGAVVTVTNLRDRATHVEWRPSSKKPGAADGRADDGRAADGGRAGGGRAADGRAAGGGRVGVGCADDGRVDRWRDRQLPERFRLARWAGVFGVRPVDLLDVTGEQVLTQSLRDGIAMSDGSAADPIRRYVAGAAAGRPGGRLLVYATDWAESPAFDSFAALIVGLGMALRVTACELPRHPDQPMLTYGLFWGVDAVRPTAAIDETAALDRPLGASVQQAVGDCLRYLELRVTEMLPDDSVQPVPAPQQLVPSAVPDIVGRLTALAAACPGQVAAAHLDHAGCRYWSSLAGR